MGEPEQERSLDQAGELLRAIALYRVCVGEVVDLKSEYRALSNRVKELPAEIEQAEMREAEARRALLAAARGSHGEEANSQVKSEVDAGIRRLASAG